MRIMTIYEHFRAYGGMNLFCRALGVTKQILWGAFCQKFLINAHNPHNLRIVKTAGLENMRIMTIYEEGIFKGFYLPRIEMEIWSRPFYGAVMRIYEDGPRQSSYFGGGAG